ncbi:MAG: FGGY-family carbohydrate kinase [Leptospiraceae bacterium]|nr:FGGY-family carbohydrate kinase [Leptospiraceae bacterium]MDW8306354.1 FGGY-family carbohydrate kinase [Leptospiraceae bacterium]
MAAHILAIDLGTSGPKVAVVDKRGNVKALEIRRVPLIFPPSGGVEQDAQEWWRSTSQAIQALWQSFSQKKEICGIIVTSQWSTLVPVDEEANPLNHAISWMDTRGAPYVAKLFRGFLQYQGYDILKLGQWLWITGGVPGNSGKDTLAHILFLKNELPHIYEKSYKLLEAKDFLNAKLTGRFAATPDSLTLYWLTDNRDPFSVRYHPELLRLTQIAEEKLPEIVPVASVLGELTPKAAEELGLSPGIPVLTGCPDMQASAIGSGGIEPLDPHLYVGSSQWISCHMRERKISPESNMATIPSALPGYYLIGNEQECAGFCVDYFLENLVYHPLLERPKAANPYSVFEALTHKAPPGAKRLIFTPWLYGERTPVENKSIRGGFHNLSAEHSLADMARSVLEGVSFNARWLLENVENFAMQKWHTLRMIGGGAQNELWCQIMADVLGRQVWVPENPRHAPLLGAALLGFYSLGLLELDALKTVVSQGKTYYPQEANRKIYDLLYQEFREIYTTHSRICAKLNL